MGRRQFAVLLGYTGTSRTNWLVVKRYEIGEREIPPTIERLIRMLVWFQSDFGYLPDFDSDGREPMILPDAFQDDNERTE